MPTVPYKPASLAQTANTNQACELRANHNQKKGNQMRLRTRLVAAASALALAGGLTLTFASPAFASGDFQVDNYEWETGVLGEGLGQAVALSTVVDNFQVGAEQTVDGHHWYQYEDNVWPGDCLQANVADTTVTLGGCDASSNRQFWWWPETDGKGPLENLQFRTFAYAGGAYDLSMNLSKTDSGEAFLWYEPAVS
jgi:hypothetical protein